MNLKLLGVAVLSAVLLFAGEQAKAQSNIGEAQQLIAQWQDSNTTCRNPNAAALAAIGACERRDTLSKLLAQSSYCYGPAEGTGPAAWASCDRNASVGQPGAKAQPEPARARSTERFQRMGGVFVLPANVNGSSKAYFVVDSGAANIQIPQEVADEMMRNGTLGDADFLGQQRFTLADGTGLQQRIFRLKTIKIGERTMENVMAAIGAPRSRALLGQSFLRRLSWWKIDNVNNTIEFEFTGSFNGE